MPEVTEPDTGHGRQVTPLELLFDLVFVFAVTQVTTLIANRPTWSGVLHGLLLLSVLWWAWSAYAWLTNRLDPEEGVVRFLVFAAVGAMLVIALAAPRAFGRDAATFGIAYVGVRVLHLVLFAIAGRGDHDQLHAIARLTPTALAGPALLVVAAFLHGGAQLGCWAVAAAVDYAGPLLGMRGWRVSPAHFVERFGQFILIALGESIVAIGVGAQGLSLDAALLGAALLGICVIACIWWSYFDWVFYVAKTRLAEVSGIRRAVLARDAYSYIHLPMVGGIVLFAFGLKTAMHDTTRPLGMVAAFGLAGGVALYLLAHVALRLRIGGGLGHGRPVAAVVLLAVLPAVASVPILAALGIVAGVCVALITYETVAHRQERAAIRGHRNET